MIRAEILPEGDSAVTVCFEEEISERVNGMVLSFYDLVMDARIPGVADVIPAYRSLTVCYNPGITAYGEIRAALQRLLESVRPRAGGAARTIELPVCYGGAHGPDLSEVARHCGMARDELIRAHAAPTYLVYMLGFTPGFPYLGGMDKRLAMPRLDEPRTLIPVGSVGIAGEQTGVYPMDSPGGWRLIGKTPVRLFDAARARPSLFRAGDRVKFVSIGQAEYDAIEAKVKESKYFCAGQEESL